MTLEEAKHELERFVELKTTMRPTFVDVLLKAEEVRHGRWIYKGIRGRFPVCECSVCGNAENADWAVMGNNVNYCPNCGAKMDED